MNPGKETVTRDLGPSVVINRFIGIPDNVNIKESPVYLNKALYILEGLVDKSSWVGITLLTSKPYNLLLKLMVVPNWMWDKAQIEAISALMVKVILLYNQLKAVDES